MSFDSFVARRHGYVRATASLLCVLGVGCPHSVPVGGDASVPDARAEKEFEVQVTPDRDSVVEGEVITFAVDVTGRRAAPVTIQIGLDRMEDAATNTSALVVPAGSAPFHADVSVTAIQDPVPEDAEQVHLRVGPYSSADPVIDGIWATEHSFWIDDDDVISGIDLVLTITSTEKQTSESRGVVTVSVVPTAPIARHVAFEVFVDPPAEASVAFPYVVFGSDVPPQEITITGLDDDVDDGDVEYVLHVGKYTLHLVNLDDDTAGIAFASVPSSVAESGGAVSVGVSLTSRPSGAVHVDLASSLPSRVTLSPASLDFDGTDWNVEKTVTLAPIPDTIPDGTQTLELTATSHSVDDALYGAGLVASASLSLTDGSDRGIELVPLVSHPSEDRGIGVYAVHLATRPTAPVTVAVSTSDESVAVLVDEAFAKVSTLELVFDADDWSTDKLVRFRGVPDAASRWWGRETTLSASVVNAASTGSGYEGVEAAATLWVEDRQPATLASTANGSSLLTGPSRLPEPISAESVVFITDDFFDQDSYPDFVIGTLARYEPRSDGVLGGQRASAGTRAACRPGGLYDACVFVHFEGRDELDVEEDADVYFEGLRLTNGPPTMTHDGTTYTASFADLALGGSTVVYTVVWDPNALVPSTVLAWPWASRLTELASVPPLAFPLSFGSCDHGSIAADRYVVFQCRVGAAGSTHREVFLRDLATHTTHHVSATSAGQIAGGDSFDPVISGNGRYVAFASDAALVPEDSNGVRDVYVFDRIAGTLSSYALPVTYASDLDISDDGVRVIFMTAEQQIGFLDLRTHNYARVDLASITIAGRPVPNGLCNEPRIEPSGSYVFATCAADNLVDIDGNGLADDDTNGVTDIYRFPLP